MKEIDQRLNAMKKRLNGITGRQAFRNAQSEVSAVRAWYDRSKRTLSKTDAKRVKQHVKNAKSKLSALGDLNSIPTIPRSLMNRVRRKSPQQNAYTYALQISSYIRNIKMSLDNLRIFKSFSLSPRMHDGISANRLRSVRWDKNLTDRKDSVRVVVVSVQAANKALGQIQRALEEIKPYVQKLRAINAAQANQVERQWNNVWNQMTMEQKLVKEWATIPKEYQNVFLNIQRRSAAKLNRNKRNAWKYAPASPSISEENYYGHKVLYPPQWKGPTPLWLPGVPY